LTDIIAVECDSIFVLRTRYYKLLSHDFMSSRSASSHFEVNARICFIKRLYKTLSRLFILYHWQPETVTLMTATGIFPSKLLTSTFRLFSINTFLVYELYNPSENILLNNSSFNKTKSYSLIIVCCGWLELQFWSFSAHSNLSSPSTFPIFYVPNQPSSLE
jgi:hypothetical protein